MELPVSLKNLKIAIVYDRLTTNFGGAEYVLQSLLSVFPDADLWTSVYDQKRASWLKNCQVHTSWLQHIPTAKRFYRSWVGAMPLAFESLDLAEYQVVISVTSGEAKGVITKPDQLHVCYLLTPTRYLWSHSDHYQQSWSAEIRKSIFRYLRWWDEAAAFRPDVYIPISELVAQRCQKYYGRSALPVIYPPVNINAFQTVSQVPTNLPANYWLMVGRLVEYKGFAQAIHAAAQLQQQLIIVGEGPDKEKLQDYARELDANVIFALTVQPEQLTAYYAGCIGFLAPGEEDFGITTIEALAAGKPVIVCKNSGAAECVVEKKTGLLLAENTANDVMEAMKLCLKLSWNAKSIQQSVRTYDTSHFHTRFVCCLEAQWARHQREFKQKGLNDR